MIFASVTFLFIFLPIVLLLYFCARDSVRNIILLTASLIFYAWGEPVYIVLMLASIVINYIFGLLIGKFSNKAIVFSGVAIDLGLLLVFKYSGFVVDNINALFNSSVLSNPDIELPIGISFYTFQALSYLIDVYRKEVKVQKNPLDFALYISLFPQLIAGPIVRYSVVEQEIKTRTVTFEGVYEGTVRFVAGMAKKVLIANQLAAVADKIFALPQDELFFGISWIGIICYSFQILFDFSGYSDMAIGLGRIFGFHFNENFNNPYAAVSIQDFWRRWHISLSSWFRDYLYIPLGGNRKGKIRTFVNQLIVFILCGFWHGAQWTFIVWGLYHGIFLCLEKISAIKNCLDKLPSVLKHIYSLVVVAIGWVFFRCDTLPQAVRYIGSMFGADGFTSNHYYFNEFMTGTAWIAIVAGIILCIPWKELSKFDHFRKSPVIEVARPVFMLALMFICILFIASGTYNPFIYFRF